MKIMFAIRDTTLFTDSLLSHELKTDPLFCSINFKQYEKPEKEVPVNSEVLKALQEQEAALRGVAGLAELQEDRGQTSN